MENLLQLVLTLAVAVVAITLIVAVSHLSAIRKSLQELARQGRMAVQPARSALAPERTQAAEEVASQPQPIYRPVVVSPPPAPALIERTRFEEVPEEAPARSRPMVVSPPPPPPPLEPTHFGEAPEQPLLDEEIPERALSPEEVADQTVPSDRPEMVNPSQPSAEAKPSRLPTIIGIVVLVLAVGFLVFVVLYTK